VRARAVRTLTVRTLTVLGCDGSWPGPGGNGSSYLVRAGGTSLLLDAGPGAFSELQKRADPRELTAVVLTHEHPDHWTDLEALASWAGHGPGRERFTGPDRALPVFAPPGLRAWSHFSDAAWIDWRGLAPSMVLTMGSLQARFAATDHGPPTLAVHLAHQGATLAYSADSGPGWSAEELGQDIGTLLCEATYTQEHEGSFQHMSGREAGAMARAAGVRRLILTHRWPTVSADEVRREAADAFGVPVEQAATGAVFDW
jgi:ribonuclease BN (tRNA processing enzyme)